MLQVIRRQEQVFVRKVIELHDKYMAYVNDCFMNHTLFHKALKEAFEIFYNKGISGSSSAELLATFCDNILKKGGSEKLSDEAIEDTLEKAFKLLAYISNKDLFAEFYWKKLARRLLFDKSANDEHERSILTKLKQQCGGQFTSKMEGMLQVFNSLNQVTCASNCITGLRATSSHIGDAGPDGATGGRQLAGEIREGGRKRVLSVVGSLDAAGDCDEAANNSVFPLRVGTRGISGIWVPVGGELGCLQSLDTKFFWPKILRFMYANSGTSIHTCLQQCIQTKEIGKDTTEIGNVSELLQSCWLILLHGQ
ncbi:unnamed protein product [Lactuca virosa]|uniref:Cullin family profile domain-containing protein n=1 Tax=Lactuca virosa TaxID=75947 RepID=A0AAU9LW87_9ASTR|nr:unnamed protein product [Lactuca virosa]